MRIDKEKVKFYLQVGLAFFVVWLFDDIDNEKTTFFGRFINNFWRALYVTVLNFFLFEYILPRVSLKKIIRSLFLLFAQFLLYSFGLYAWRALGILLHIYTPYRTDATIVDGVGYHFPYSVASVFFFGIIKHIYDYNQLKKAAQQLRIEKQEAELNFLKSQTNPHFLFNTLNNIYSLSRDKSDLAPESILRLSKILRFMLYEAGGEFIAIEHELKIIGDYIDLEKLRYDESLRINFNYNIEDMKQAIPPLLLIPLVENAFKHGVSETRNQPFVDIHLSVNQRQLTLVVKNSTEVIDGDRKINEHIGITNLRRQLHLFYSDYNLSLQQGDSIFTSILKINLASHV